MKFTTGWLAGATLAAAAALMPPAQAQDVLHDPEAIRACLCEEQAVAAITAALHQDDQSFAERRKELQSLDDQAAAARAQLDPADIAGRERLGGLLDARDAAHNRFIVEITPRHNDMVARYNAVIGGFNQQCGGRNYDSEVLARLRATLACPDAVVAPSPR